MEEGGRGAGGRWREEEVLEVGARGVEVLEVGAGGRRGVGGRCKREKELLEVGAGGCRGVGGRCRGM